MPKNSIVDYETAIKADRFVLLLNGTAEEIKRAKGVLTTSGAERAETGQQSRPESAVASNVSLAAFARLQPDTAVRLLLQG